MEKNLLLVATILFLLTGCSSVQKVLPEEQFKKSFPKNKYESFAKTSVHGVYEVYNGSQVYYYLPEGDVIIAGNMISRDGKNLTQESIDKRMVARLAKLPLDSALKIGTGKTAVVEFIDPNCHYCRLSFNFFAGRMKDVALYVFFYPLSQDSVNKIRHIVCAQDKTKAYDDVLSGKLDGSDKLNLCGDKGAEDMMKAHQEASAKIGVRATPLFYIKGKVVPGFDQPAIEKLLAE